MPLAELVPPPFAVRSVRLGGRTVISVEGELDCGTIGLVRREVERRRACCPSLLTLDLSATTFMDASGLRLIEELAANQEAASAHLALVVATRPVRRILELVPPPERVSIVGHVSNLARRRA